jgi:hypothetical protein
MYIYYISEIFMFSHLVSQFGISILDNLVLWCIKNQSVYAHNSQILNIEYMGILVHPLKLGITDLEAGGVGDNESGLSTKCV